MQDNDRAHLFTAGRKKKRVSRFDRASGVESPPEAEEAVDTSNAIMPYREPNTDFTHYLTAVLQAEPGPQPHSASWSNRYSPPGPPSGLISQSGSSMMACLGCSSAHDPLLSCTMRPYDILVCRAWVWVRFSISRQATETPLPSHIDVYYASAAASDLGEQENAAFLRALMVQDKCTAQHEGRELSLHRNESSKHFS